MFTGPIKTPCQCPYSQPSPAATQWDVPPPADSSSKRQSAALRVTAMKVGDVVQLNSGGPPMTVVGVGSEKVRCKWFDSKNAVQIGEFVNGSVRPVDAGPGAGGSKTKDAD